jgi:hypothetical protein
MNMKITRRQALATIAAAQATLLLRQARSAQDEPRFRLATFKSDITTPVGHPLLGGLQKPAATIKERLEARGLVLLGEERSLAIVSLDWCELRNDAYDAFRDAIAEKLGTTREQVLLSCIHQHDAPYFDLTAQQLLDDAALPGAMFDREFFDDCVQRTAKAAADALAQAQPLTHFGVGSAKVERIACNRRVELSPGKPTFSRYSFTSDPAIRDAPEGTIDPLLRTLGFYDGEKLLATLSVYAVHPMSYYGRGEVSYDFPGLARQAIDEQQPETFHLYASGCSGDVVAARYNEGNEAARTALADRLATAMSESIKHMQREPLARLTFRSVPLELPPPHEGPLAPETLKATIADKSLAAAARITAALGYSYYLRCEKNPRIDVPAIDFGPATYLILPAEMFVAYQLHAQKLAPEKSILVTGFGECAPGYIPTEQARAEGFVEEHAYCWNRPGAEEAIHATLERLLAASVDR